MLGSPGYYPPLSTVRRPHQQGPQNAPYALSPPGNVYGPRPPGDYGLTGLSPTANQLPISEQLMGAAAYGAQQSPMGGFQNGGSQAPGSMQTLVQAMEASAPPGPSSMPDASLGGSGGLLDSGDLAQYNFDPASFNFGNHYGALEFGMLGHMSSGAAETSPSDAMSQLNPATGGMFAGPGSMPAATYSSESPMSAQTYMFGQDQSLAEWRPPTQPQSNVRQAATAPNSASGGDGGGLAGSERLDGLIVDSAGGSAVPSPTSSRSAFPSSSRPDSRPSTRGRPAVAPRSTNQPSAPQPSDTARRPANNHALGPSRKGDPSRVYNDIRLPHDYTAGFHNLFAFIRRRFPRDKTVLIAEALAKIRPSFISCNRTLVPEDLVFMYVRFSNLPLRRGEERGAIFIASSLFPRIWNSFLPAPLPSPAL